MKKNLVPAKCDIRCLLENATFWSHGIALDSILQYIPELNILLCLSELIFCIITRIQYTLVFCQHCKVSKRTENDCCCESQAICSCTVYKSFMTAVLMLKELTTEGIKRVWNLGMHIPLSSPYRQATNFMMTDTSTRPIPRCRDKLSTVTVENICSKEKEQRLERNLYDVSLINLIINTRPRLFTLFSNIWKPLLNSCQYNVENST